MFSFRVKEKLTLVFFSFFLWRRCFDLHFVYRGLYMWRVFMYPAALNGSSQPWEKEGPAADWRSATTSSRARLAYWVMSHIRLCARTQEHHYTCRYAMWSKYMFHQTYVTFVFMTRILSYIIIYKYHINRMKNLSKNLIKIHIHTYTRCLDASYFNSCIFRKIFSLSLILIPSRNNSEIINIFECFLT